MTNNQSNAPSLNTPDRFSLMSITFHWVIGLMILAVIALSYYMESLPNSSYKFQVYNLHKSIGFLVLVLAIPRILWRLGHGRPPKIETHKAWEHRLSSLVAWAMYGLLFLMPLTGFFMGAAYGYPFKLFNILEIPGMISKNQELGNLLNQLHDLGGEVLQILIILHVAGTLKHLTIDKDNTLYRMLPFNFFKKD
jgi:cytochrome b561